MNLNKTDLETLARSRAEKKTKSKALTGLVVGGGLLLILGAFLLWSGQVYGIGVAGAGVVAFGVATVVRGKKVARYIEWFENYYTEHGELPPNEDS